MQPNVAILLVMVASFATLAWVMYLISETSKRQRRTKAQSELQGRLLDKFSSAHEVAEFLQTQGGAQFVNSFSGEREEPAAGILRSTHRGIVLVIVGLGCLGLTRAYGWEDNPLLVIGVILLCLGLGFLISAVASHRLSKVLGLSARSGDPQQ
ncbi:MAG TPA: hypothetical protein VMR62_08045 [Bryobacteraceae bacterium]|jgi:Flp pilus assembly protein TadB|nr:hypothetical protein [Bryobacteraceae bacterium]